jgi:hypothetical protein
VQAHECIFEDEVLAMALQSRWPDRVPAELREHVAGCILCRDLAEAASSISESREDLAASATLPDAGRIWWMTQLRARRQAIQTAGRPITAIQVAALGCAAGLAGACFGATSAWFQSALHWTSMELSTSGVRALVMEHGAVAGGIAALVVLLPAVVYVAIDRDRQ